MAQTAVGKIYYVYTLTDPRDGSVHYVGMSNNPEKRFGEHTRPSGETCNPGKDAWISDLRQYGLLPQQNIIDSAPTRKEAGEVERQWVNHYKSQQAPLTNQRRGQRWE